MLLVHIGIASLRQFQCAPTTYVYSIHKCFAANNITDKLSIEANRVDPEQTAPIGAV